MLYHWVKHMAMKCHSQGNWDFLFSDSCSFFIDNSFPNFIKLYKVKPPGLLYQWVCGSEVLSQLDNHTFPGRAPSSALHTQTQTHVGKGCLWGMVCLHHFLHPSVPSALLEEAALWLDPSIELQYFPNPILIFMKIILFNNYGGLGFGFSSSYEISEIHNTPEFLLISEWKLLYMIKD